MPTIRDLLVARIDDASPALAFEDERWECSDSVWWKPEKGAAYRRLEQQDVEAIRGEFDRRGRRSALQAL